MALPKTSPQAIEQIHAALAGETNASVARRLGVSVATVKRYRRQGRRAAQEAAREAIAQHVQETVPGALEDLTALRGLAGGQYRLTRDARDGMLWLNAIKTTLDHVTPDDAELDREIAAELERLAGAEEAPRAGEAAGPIGR